MGGGGASTTLTRRLREGGREGGREEGKRKETACTAIKKRCTDSVLVQNFCSCCFTCTLFALVIRALFYLSVLPFLLPPS